jgi:hypothetical protein
MDIYIFTIIYNAGIISMKILTSFNSEIILQVMPWLFPDLAAMMAFVSLLTAVSPMGAWSIQT